MLNATIITESQIYVTIYELCIRGHLIIFVLIPEEVLGVGVEAGIGRVTISLENSPKKMRSLIR